MDDLYFAFFNNLIQNHPDYEKKSGVGIEYFSIKPNPVAPKFYEMMITRIDGTNEVFSWVYCCQFKTRTVADNLTRAMRASISTDVISLLQESTDSIILPIL